MPTITEVNAAVSSTSVMDFHDYEYVDLAQIAHIRNNDLNAQDTSLVTAGVRAMMDAAMAFVEEGGAKGKTAVIHCHGVFSMSDEIFSETFAQKLWDLSTITNTNARTNARFIFDLEGATFQADGWDSHKAVRTSGYYGLHEITDAVPSVMFRWEQRVKKGLGPYILGGTLAGERALTDPIGLRMRNVNSGYQSAFEIRNFLNIGRMIDDVNNTDFIGSVIHGCGYQPTQAGGSGFVSDSVRVATEAGVGSTTVTATEPIFNMADHVGKWLMVQSAGEGGTEFAAKITAVIDPNVAVLDRQCATDVSSNHVSFAMLSGSTTAGSATLELDTDVTDDMIGRYVMVYKGGSGIHLETDTLVTRVVGHDAGKILTLATQARETVTGSPVCVAPSTFMGKSDDQVQGDGVTPESGHNNDCQFIGERVEYSFDPVWGSAICAVEQFVLATQFVGRKTHGTNAAYNNFGANGMNRWLDNCKFYNSVSEQYEWGDWHPDYGKVCIVGARSMISLANVNIGGFQTLDHVAEILIDPQAASSTDCRVLLSGFRNTVPQQAGLANQDFIRYGTHGNASMVSAAGPFVSRGVAGYPDMPNQHVSRIEMFNTTPTIIMHDTNGSTGFRMSSNGGRIEFLHDSTNNGVYDAGGFGWTKAGGLFVKDSDGAENFIFDRGTFTPTLELGGVEISALGGAYSAQAGEFLRVFDRVYVRAAITLSVLGAATGSADIRLPPSLRPVNYNEHLGSGLYSGMSGVYGGVIGATLGGAKDVIRLRYPGAGGTGFSDITDSNLGNSSRVEVSGWFKI